MCKCVNNHVGTCAVLNNAGMYCFASVFTCGLAAILFPDSIVLYSGKCGSRLVYKLILAGHYVMMTRGSEYGLPSLCNDVMHYDIISVITLVKF